METVNFDSVESLRKSGFAGFKSIGELILDSSCIPQEKGVYLIVRTKKSSSLFMTVGSGGHFKGRNPNIPKTQLQQEWVADTSVVYIGKAGSETGGATLQSRLRQYLRFGQGANVGHWGGRLIWQLADSIDLLVCWKTLPNDDPREVERELITKFKEQYSGKRPFANLQD